MILFWKGFIVRESNQEVTNAGTNWIEIAEKHGGVPIIFAKIRSMIINAPKRFRRTCDKQRHLA